jgi:UDP-N-acetylmuramoylalanine--D-glutamate ligase
VRFSELEHCKVGILGIGREGLAVKNAIRERFPNKVLTLFSELPLDEGNSGQLNATLDRIETGPLSAMDLQQFDVLVRSPGISPYRPELRAAAQAGVQFTSASSLWFATNPDANTICVTGTKGKSTTASMIAHLLSAAGLTVRLAGNIGQPMLDCGSPQAVDWWVLELSSYQISDLEGRPGISVLLNLTPEHLDWHGGEVAYKRDKLRLIELAAGGPVVANAEDPELRRVLAGRDDTHWFGGTAGFAVQGGWLSDNGKAVPGAGLKDIPGRHNLMNLAAALTAVQLAGYDANALASSIHSFSPLPHRLELLGRRNQVTWVNDSISTTPVATLAALQAISNSQLVLIIGGLDRGLDWTHFADRVAENAPHAVIGLPDNGPDLVKLLAQRDVRPEAGLHIAKDMPVAVALARQLTGPGGMVLLSPGAPSFPQYRDFRARGRAFAECAGFASIDQRAKKKGAYETPL